MNKRDFLLLFYSLPMSDRDRQKFLETGAHRAILVFDFAPHDTAFLAAHGVSYVLRLNESNYATPGARLAVIAQILLMSPEERRKLEMVQIGVEPEGHLDLTWGSSTGWGNTKKGPDGYTDLERHRANHKAMREMLQKEGVKVATPGFRCRNQDGRFGPAPDNGPQPGLVRWYNYLLEEYGLADYNGGHIYTFDGTDYDVSQRGGQMLCRIVEAGQREILIDECNIGDGKQTPEQAMQGALKIVEMARTSPGARTVGAAPFVMNGTPNGQWPKHQLMQSDECYRLVRSWLE